MTEETRKRGAATTQAAPKGERFSPFEQTFICDGCNRPIQLYLQPVHLEIEIHCPRCQRPLTLAIRKAIREHRQEL